MTVAGEDMKAKFISQYGEKKGTQYFYSYLSEHPAIGKKVHKTKSGKKRYEKIMANKKKSSKA